MQDRQMLLQTLSMALLSWSVHVFQPAILLRRLGLYAPSTLGTRPVPRVHKGGGPGLSRQNPSPVLLEGEPAGYEGVREFDHISANYDLGTRPYSQPIFDELIALMRLYIADDARILDPSAGAGRDAIELSRLVPRGEVVAADLSRGMVEVAHKNAIEQGRTNLAFFQADVAQPPPVFEGYFDALFCNLAFHHYPDGAAAARTFRKVLAPHGKAFIADPGPAWFVKMAREFTLLTDPGFVCHRTGEEFQKLLLDAGFSSVYWIEALPSIGITIASV